MSWEGEFGGARAHHAETEENEIDLAVGKKVYRAHFGKIEEGVVIRVERVSFTKDGCATEFADPNGKYTSYTARFHGGFGGCESQTSQWRFYARRGEACAKLAREAKREAEELRLKAAKADGLAAQMLAEDRDDATPRSVAWARWHDGFMPTKRTTWTPEDIDLGLLLWTEEFEHNHVELRAVRALESYCLEVFADNIRDAAMTEIIGRVAKTHPTEAVAMTVGMQRRQDLAERARIRREEREKLKVSEPVTQVES